MNIKKSMALLFGKPKEKEQSFSAPQFLEEAFSKYDILSKYEQEEIHIHDMDEFNIEYTPVTFTEMFEYENTNTD